MITMEKIVSLCKRRGFVYPGSDIYGGLANTYDYGPLGTELKNNIKQAWWKYFIQDREDMVGLDGGILMSPKIWEASGHTEKFKDPLVECKKCHKRFRPDKLKDASKCPECGGGFTEEKFFSGMFETVIGPVEKEGVKTYLRPETAQAIFVNYKNILDSTNKKIPFGIGQSGKAFRNEMTMGNFIFRTLEFEQMEIEFFISPEADWKKVFNKWLGEMYKFMDFVGLDRKKAHDMDIPDGERAHYSKKTIDIEYEFPFGQDELWGLAYRTDFDLSNHQKNSGKDLTYFDDKDQKRFIPHVIEPTFGVDRTLLAILAEAYTEEETEGGTRTVMKFNKKMAPVKIAVFPLLRNKPELVKKAREVYAQLKQNYVCEFDDNGNIGKRYRRQDEIGTLYCITVDFDSLEQNDATVRDRDTMKQERIKISELEDYFRERL
ncbi:glycine--tRNA ligase [Patescibacteria group bacterium]|nr:glycine--tRNA ligase [Patescibacteria group bacterium]MBU4082729.1 glycine--tRNA ligase [Patescibacteria group bacterium]